MQAPAGTQQLAVHLSAHSVLGELHATHRQAGACLNCAAGSWGTAAWGGSWGGGGRDAEGAVLAVCDHEVVLKGRLQGLGGMGRLLCVQLRARDALARLRRAARPHPHPLAG